jgi:hypothetical protein
LIFSLNLVDKQDEYLQIAALWKSATEAERDSIQCDIFNLPQRNKKAFLEKCRDNMESKELEFGKDLFLSLNVFKYSDPDLRSIQDLPDSFFKYVCFNKEISSFAKCSLMRFAPEPVLQKYLPWINQDDLIVFFSIRPDNFSGWKKEEFAQFLTYLPPGIFRKEEFMKSLTKVLSVNSGFSKEACLSEQINSFHEANSKKNENELIQSLTLENLFIFPFLFSGLSKGLVGDAQQEFFSSVYLKYLSNFTNAKAFSPKELYLISACTKEKCEPPLLLIYHLNRIYQHFCLSHFEIKVFDHIKQVFKTSKFENLEHTKKFLSEVFTKDNCVNLTWQERVIAYFFNIWVQAFDEKSEEKELDQSSYWLALTHIKCIPSLILDDHISHLISQKHEREALFLLTLRELAKDLTIIVDTNQVELEKYPQYLQQKEDEIDLIYGINYGPS